LWLVLKVIWGPLNNEENKKLSDCTGREAFILGTLSVFIFATGFLSAPLLAHTVPTMKKLQESVNGKTAYRTQLVIPTHSNEPMKVMMEK